MKLTEKQKQALSAAFKQGGAWFGHRGNLMGGAYRRLCLRLVALGLVGDAPPYGITVKGMVVLRDLWSARFAKHGCIAYADDLKAIESALEEFPLLAKRARERMAA